MKLKFYSIFRQNKSFFLSSIILALLTLIILVIPEMYPKGYYAITNYDNINMKPCLKHIFGTDCLGRDIFIRVLEACKISLKIAIVSTFIAVFIGTFYGIISGFYGGRVDRVMMRIVDGLYAIPFIFLSILLVAIFGRSFYLIYMAIACVSWLDIARVVRGQTLEIKNKEYILAAKIMGLSNMQIIFGHILHNLYGTILLFATLTIPSILYTSAFLGFLGFGVQPPLAGLGELINEGSTNMSIGYWWSLLFPCLALVLILLCLHYVSNGIRTYLESKD